MSLVQFSTPDETIRSTHILKGENDLKILKESVFTEMISTKDVRLDFKFITFADQMTIFRSWSVKHKLKCVFLDSTHAGTCCKTHPVSIVSLGSRTYLGAAHPLKKSPNCQGKRDKYANVPSREQLGCKLASPPPEKNKVYYLICLAMHQL